MALKPAKIPHLWMSEVEPATASLELDAKNDWLYFRTGPGRPTVSVSIDSELWLHADPQTGEVYGFEIEAFERDFLKRHHDQWSLWEPIAKAEISNGLTPDGIRFIQAIWKLLRDPRVPALKFRKA